MKSYEKMAREADADFEAFESGEVELRPVQVALNYKGSIFSVRLKPEEIAILGKAANKRGLKLGAFIRQAALAAAAGELELDGAERAALAAELREKLREAEAVASRL